MQAKDRFRGSRRIARAVRAAAKPGLVFAGLLLASVFALAQTPAPPAPLIVSDVIIQGNRLVSAEAIKNQIKTRPGVPFVPETVQEDVRTLYKSGQFGNVWADRQDDGPGKVKVLLYVRDYPNVIKKVTYQGNRSLSKDDLEGVTNVRVGQPLNPIVNKGACSRVVARYNEEGRPFAACDLLKGADPADDEVVFNVNEGPLTRVKSIAFTGNSFVSSGVLSNHVNTSTKFLGLRIGGKYNPAMTDNDVNELMKYYRGFGFHDVKVARELQFSPDGCDVAVTFHVVEGVQYRLADRPHVTGSKTISPEELEAMTKTKAGQNYKQSDVDADMAIIRDWFGYRGTEARVVATPVFSQDTPGVMRVQYEGAEQPPAKVGHMIIIGSQNILLGTERRDQPPEILDVMRSLREAANLWRLW